MATAVHRARHRGLLRHRQGTRFGRRAYELRGDGSAILVPRDQVARLRMTLAQRRPADGRRASATRSSTRATPSRPPSFVQNINQLRALEGELARTIRSIDRVAGGARPSRHARAARCSSATGEAPRASIVLKVARRARRRPGPRHPPPRRLGRRGPEARARLDRRRARPPARRRRRGDDRLAAGRRRSARAHRAAASRRRSRISSPASSARAAPGSRSPPSSTSTASSRRSETSIPRAGSSARPRRATRTPRPAGREAPVTRRQRAARRRRSGSGASRREASTKQERGDHQLRDLAARPRPRCVEGGRVKRLSVAVLVDGVYAQDAERQAAPTSRARQEEIERIAAAGALGDRLRQGARRPGRGRQPALRRGAAGASDRRADADQRCSRFDQGRHDAHAPSWACCRSWPLIVLIFVVRPLLRRSADAADALPRRAPPGRRARRHRRRARAARRGGAHRGRLPPPRTSADRAA